MGYDDHGALALRVAIADDHRPFARGLAAWLEELGATVTGIAGNADELDAVVAAAPPDVVMVDVAMPPDRTDEGIRFAEDLDASHPGIGVLVVSSYQEPVWARRLLSRRQQGVGYLLKDTLDDSSVLRDALRSVARGGVVVDPKIAEQIAVPSPQQGPGSGLTPREIEVLREMAGGRSNQAIADRLVISPRTVENHVRRTFEKLGLVADPNENSRVRAVLWFQENARRLDVPEA